MYIKINDTQTLASPHVRVNGTTWQRLDALVKIDGAWRGWFRKSGTLAAVVNDAWSNHIPEGGWVYLWQYRYITPAAFANPIRIMSAQLSARIENRDDYDSSYDIRIEGLINGVWTLLGSSPVVIIPRNSWGIVSVNIAVTHMLEVAQVRYGIGTKHFYDQVNGSVTGWEEFGTYTG